MPITIVNKVPDLAERERINVQIEKVLDSSPINWHIRILPAQGNDEVEVRANAHGQDFSQTFHGIDGQLPDSIREFIQGARTSAEQVAKVGEAATSRDAILTAFQLLSGASAGIESWI